MEDASELPHDSNRLILIMDDNELELFCRQWVDARSDYQEVIRFGEPVVPDRQIVTTSTLRALAATATH
jgi:hypothetical protein